MTHSFEELRRRYADSIWLRSETTEISGPIRNNFDPPDLQAIRPQQYRVTITTASGKHYSVETCGEVSYALFDTGQRLIIFCTVFGDSLAEFAVVTERVVSDKETQKLSHTKALPSHSGLPAIP